MKSFGTSLYLAAIASAVNVNKANHNPAFDRPAPVQNHGHGHVEPVHHETEYYYEEPHQEIHTEVGTIHPSHAPLAGDHGPFEHVDDQHHIEHHADDFEDYYVTGEEYVTGNSYIVPQPTFDPAPRYWDDHLHYTGGTRVNFYEPAPYVAEPVNWNTPRFHPYVPSYKNHYFSVEDKEVDNQFGDLFTPYNFFEPVADDHYGDPIYDPKNDKLHGKPKKEEKEEDIHAHHDDHHEEEHHEEEDHHDDHHEEVHIHTGEVVGCDCSDVAAERDAAIVDRDQAVSELALYKLAFGEILPEQSAPVYVPDTTESSTVSYEDQYEYSYYEPESYDLTVHDDIPFEHDPVTTEYYPTEEELAFFDTPDYAPESYYKPEDTWGYFDHVVNSFAGATDFSNHDFEAEAEPAPARAQPQRQRARRNHGHGHRH